jgi:hypothetical protein
MITAIKVITAMRQLRLPVPSNSVEAYDTTLEMNLHSKSSAEVIIKLKKMKAEDFGKRVVRDVGHVIDNG